MQEFDIETGLKCRLAPSGEREVIQSRLIQHHLQQAAKSPYYKKLFAEKRIDINEIRSVSDLSELPLTSRKELDEQRQNLWAVSQEQVVDLSLTSGTTGTPDSIIRWRAAILSPNKRMVSAPGPI